MFRKKEKKSSHDKYNLKINKNKVFKNEKQTITKSEHHQEENNDIIPVTKYEQYKKSQKEIHYTNGNSNTSHAANNIHSSNMYTILSTISAHKDSSLSNRNGR